MLVEEIMKTGIVSLHKEDTIQTAMDLLSKHRIRHLPVIDESDIIIGMVADRDIRDARPSIFHAQDHIEDLQKPISSIMKYPVITAHPLDFVEEAAYTLYQHDISCLPIAKDDKLVGLITETDILHTMVKLTGAHQPSSQIEIRVPNLPGHLADLASIFKEHKVNVASVLVYPCNDQNYKILTFRVQTMDPRKVIELVKSHGYVVKWPNMPGIEQ